MMSVLHLLWIVPMCVSAAALIIALLGYAGKGR